MLGGESGHRIRDGGFGLADAPRFVAFALDRPSFAPFDAELEVDAVLVASGAGVVEFGGDDLAFHFPPVAFDDEGDAGVEEIQKKVLKFLGRECVETRSTIFVEVRD